MSFAFSNITNNHASSRTTNQAPSGIPYPSTENTAPSHVQSSVFIPRTNCAGTQPGIDPLLQAEEMPARFIDALANQFGFGDGEQDLRQNLHGFAKVSYCLISVGMTHVGT